MGNVFERRPALTFVILWTVFLCLVELALRMALPGAVMVDGSAAAIVPDRLVYKDYAPNSEFLRKPDRFDTFPDALNEINSLGIRGPEIRPKQAYRVINIGDSFIQADEVVFEATFGELLNREFKGKIEYISHGISSWSPTPMFSWLYHKGLSLDPDEINLFLTVNDFYRPEVYDSDAFYRKRAIYEGKVPAGYDISLSPSQKARAVLKEIVLVRLSVQGYRSLKQKLRAHSAAKPPVPLAQEIVLLSKPSSQWPAELKREVDSCIGVIADMHSFASSRGIGLNVLLVPLGFAWQDEAVHGKQAPGYEWPADFTVSQKGVEDYLEATLKANGISYIPLQPYFARAKQERAARLLFNEADGHWNANGHMAVFEALKDHYKKSGPNGSGGQEAAGS